MSAPAGWYPDPQRPPGHLRYWDGRRWSDHRHVVPAPSARPVREAPQWAPPAAAATSRSSGSWARRHKLATAALTVLGVTLVASALPDEDALVAAGTQGASTETGGVGQGDVPVGASDGDEPGAAKATPGARTERKRPGPVVRGPEPRPAAPRLVVARVVDGDTVELDNGETVRLVGIDTPEVGECGFEAASAALADLVLGRSVTLGRSDEDRDSYGRLLRYVDVGRVDAGLRLIRSGRAIAAYDSRDGYGFHPREPRYVAGDRGSRNLCPMQTGQRSESAPEPASTPARKPQPLVGGGGSDGGAAGQGCAAGYRPCLPLVADLDCADVRGPVRVTGPDPYRLDADGDGVGCDS